MKYSVYIMLAQVFLYFKPSFVLHFGKIANYAKNLVYQFKKTVADNFYLIPKKLSKQQNKL